MTSLPEETGGQRAARRGADTRDDNHRMLKLLIPMALAHQFFEVHTGLLPRFPQEGSRTACSKLKVPAAFGHKSGLRGRGQRAKTRLATVSWPIRHSSTRVLLVFNIFIWSWLLCGLVATPRACAGTPSPPSQTLRRAESMTALCARGPAAP